MDNSSTPLDGTGWFSRGPLTASSADKDEEALSTRPSLTAYMAASVREAAPILVKILRK